MSNWWEDDPVVGTLPKPQAGGNWWESDPIVSAPGALAGNPRADLADLANGPPTAAPSLDSLAQHPAYAPRAPQVTENPNATGFEEFDNQWRQPDYYNRSLASQFPNDPTQSRVEPVRTPAQQFEDQAAFAQQRGLPQEQIDTLKDLAYGQRVGEQQQLVKQQRKAQLLQGVGKDKWNDFDWEEYRKSLPVPIDSYDMMDQADYDRLKHVNELITGLPFADTPDKERSKKQEEIAAERQQMQKDGFDNVYDYLLAKQAKEGAQYLPSRMAGEFGQQAKTGFHNMTTGVVKAYGDILNEAGLENDLSSLMGGQADDIKRQRQEQWRQAVEAAKNKNSDIGETGASLAMQVAGTTGRMAPAQLAGLAGGTPAVLAAMGMDVGADTYNNLRSQGWAAKEALPYALATSGIEVGTEALGFAVSKALGIVNPNGAFTRQAYDTFQKMIEKGPLKTVLGIAGSMTEEGLEEVAGDILHDFKDRVARQLATKNVPDNPVTLDSLKNTFTVAALSALPGHIPAAAVYLSNLKKSDGKLLNLTPSQVEEVKQAAAQAPTTPPEAAPENVAPEPSQPIAPQAEATGEASAPVNVSNWIQNGGQTLPTPPTSEAGQELSPSESQPLPTLPAQEFGPLVAPPGTPSASVSPAAPEGPGVAPIVPPAGPPAEYANRKIKMGDRTPSSGKAWLLDAWTRAPKEVAGDPARVAEWIKGGFPDSYYWRYLKDSGQSLEQALDTVRPKAVEPSPAPKTDLPAERLGERKQYPTLTPEAFREQIKQAAISPEEADAITRLTEANAEYKGMPFDQYVAKHFAGVELGPQTDSVYLKQLAAGKVGEDLPSSMAQPAYHGSPHPKFDKFTTDKIGSGEGHQAYGWGLYFAGEKAVADYYKKTLTQNRRESDPTLRGLRDWLNGSLARLDNLGFDTTSEAIQAMRQHPDWRQRWDVDHDGKAVGDRLQEVFDAYEKRRKELGGALYKVELRPTNEELLDWDKKITEQSPQVQHAVQSAFDAVGIPNATNMNPDGDSAYTWIAAALNKGSMSDSAAKKAASQLLQQHGLRGIKYLDGTSRNKGEGSHNYVIFDDADVAIQEILAQKQGQQNPRGEAHFLKDGRAVIRAFTESRDLSTLAHELGHVFRRTLEPSELTQAEKALGVEDGKWKRSHEESFARGFERYLRDGKAPTKALADVFAKFKAWLSTVYKKLKGSPIEKDIPAELRAVFDKMLTPKRRIGEKINRESEPVTQEPTNGLSETKSQAEAQGETNGRSQGLLDEQAPDSSVPAGAEELPAWVTDDALKDEWGDEYGGMNDGPPPTDAEAPRELTPEDKSDLTRMKRAYNRRLDPETRERLNALSPSDQHAILSGAVEGADTLNDFYNRVIDEYKEFLGGPGDKIVYFDKQGNKKVRNITSGEILSAKARLAEMRGSVETKIPGFDQLTETLRRTLAGDETSTLVNLASYVQSAGNGDLDEGLYQVLQGGLAAIREKLTKPQDLVYDLVEDHYGRQAEAQTHEPELAGAEPAIGEGQGENAGAGGADGGAPQSAEGAEEPFQLSREGSKDTSPVVEPYQAPDHLTPSTRDQEKQGFLTTEMEPGSLPGQQGLFERQESANKGPRLEPLAQSPAVEPKAQRQIISDIAKGLNVPIRFGRLKNKKAGGHYLPKQDLIASALANDVPIISHEAGHKIDKMFGLSSNKAIATEINTLGDPNTPNSRSSWTPSKTQAYKRGEGVAEFVRYWLTDPAHAQKVAPNTHAAFEQILDANKDLGDTMRQAQEDIRLWRTAEPQARLRSQISRNDNPNKTRYSISQLTRDVVDDLHYLKLATNDAIKADPKLPASKQPYLLARNLRGSYGMAETFIRNGAVDFNTKHVDLGKSLEDALKPVAGRLNDFGDWIVAKRAQELHGQGKETGLVPADVDAVAKMYDNDPVFQKAFDDVKAWNDRVLQYAVDAGLVTKNSAAAMRQMNQDYVPFHRLYEVGANEPTSQASFGSGSGLNPGKPSSLKKLKGSTRTIVDPLETMVKNAYAIITASEKAAISNAVADMAKLKDMGKWVEEVAGPSSETKVPLDRIREQLEDAGADLSSVDDDLLMSFWTKASRPVYGENTIRVIGPDGQAKFYRLNRYLHDTFLALDLEDTGKLIRILSAPANLLRAGVVLEPGFNIANVMRDAFSSAVIGKYGAVPFETTIRGVAALIKNPQLVADWAASGGKSSIEYNFFDRKAMQKYLAEKISKDLTPAERAMIWTKSPLTLLRAMATTFEEATRIGEYQKAYDALIKSGLPEGEARRLAAFESRDRQDFAKGGAKTKILRHMTAFWNASLQANVKLAQSLKERPAKTLLSGLAFVTLPKLLEQALNWDDDDYWDRPQWERDAFFLIPNGKDEAGHTKFFRIPTPFEVGVLFGTVPGRFLAWAKQNKPEAVKDLPANILKQSIPNPTPQWAQLLYEDFLSGPQGWSVFRWRPIVPDSLSELPPDLQWTEQTTEAARKLGKALNFSPMKIDYLIESTTGGVGKILTGKSMPQKRFLTTPLNVSAQSIQDFYDIRSKLKQDTGRLRETGEAEGLGPVMAKQFESAADDIAKLRAKARDATGQGKAQLQEQAYHIAKDMVAKYRANQSPEDAVAEYAKQQAEIAILSHDHPKRKIGEKTSDYNDRMALWQSRHDAAQKWLMDHKDNPVVLGAVDDILHSDAYRKLTKPPTIKFGKLDPHYGEKRATFLERSGAARKMAGELGR